MKINFLTRKKIHSLFENVYYISEAQHTSDEADAVSTDIADKLLTIGKTFYNNQSALNVGDDVAIYTGYVFNEKAPRGVGAQFRMQPNWSGEHHQIFVRFSKNIGSAMMRTYSRTPNKVTGNYDDNERFLIDINSNWFFNTIVKNVLSDNTSEKNDARLKLISTLAHELTHMMYSCYVPNQTLNNKHGLYLSYIHNLNLDIDVSRFYILNNLFYYINENENRARLKQLDMFMKTVLKEDDSRVEIQNIMSENLKSYLKERKTLSKGLLIAIVLKYGPISNITQLSTINKFIQMVTVIDRDDLIRTQQLMVAGYYLLKHHLIRIKKDDVVSINRMKMFLSNENITNAGNTKIDYKDVVCLEKIKDSIYDIFYDYEWMVANKIDAFLKQIFEVDDNVDDEVLVHTVLSRAFVKNKDYIKTLYEANRLIEKFNLKERFL